MDLIKRKLDYLVIPVVIGAALIVVIHYVRDIAGLSSQAQIVIGSLPNFIAALVIPFSFFMQKIHFEKSFMKVGFFAWYIVSILLTVLGLVWWEYEQKTRIDFTYDVYDLYATFLGAVVCLISWPLVKRLTKEL